MKKTLYALSFACIGLFNQGKAQTGCNWIPLGPSDSSEICAGESYFNSIAIDPTTNTPYVAVRDGYNYYGTTVKKYSGGIWTLVGSPGFSKGSAHYQSITVDKNGKVYTAFQDGGNNNNSVCYFNGTSWVTMADTTLDPGTFQGITTDNNATPYIVYEDQIKANKAKVQMWNGSGWVSVGPTDTISFGQALYDCIAFDRVHNTPYVAFESGWDTDRLEVMTYNGTAWAPVGGSAYEFGVTPIGDTAQYVSLACSPTTGYPYVAFEDSKNGNKATVMMYNGTSWVYVGTPGISKAGVNYTSIGVDASNNVYVSYEDLGNYNGLTTMEYNGTAWAVVGAVDISIKDATYISLAIDNNNAPVVTYQDDGTQHHGEAFTYTGGQWNLLGTVGIPGAGKKNGQAAYTSIAVSPTTNYPYVAFQDGNNGYAGSVESWNGTAWSPVGALGSLSTGTAKFTSIGFDQAGDPIVALSDSKNTPKYGISVKKYSGGVWNLIGTVPAFTNYAYYLSLAVSAKDSMYVAYQDGNYATDVMMYNGTAWVLVGSANITGRTGDTCIYQSLAIDKNGVPYVAFSSNKDALGIDVYKWSGGVWTIVGSPNISKGQAVFTSLKIDPISNMPVVAYSAYGSNTEANVTAFNGKKWIAIGDSNGFSADWSNYMSLAIDSKGNYYVLYEDWCSFDCVNRGEGNCTAEECPHGDSNWYYLPVGGRVSNGGAGYVSLAASSTGNIYAAYAGWSAFALELGPCTGVGINEVTGSDNATASVYPNPSHGIFNIALQNVKGNTSLEVYNVLGEKVYQSRLQSDNAKFNLSSQPSGIYLYRILTESGSVISTGKLIVE